MSALRKPVQLSSRQLALTSSTSIQNPSSAPLRMSSSPSGPSPQPSPLPELPRLPVPSLDQSLKLYLRSIIPLLLQAAGPDFEAEYNRRQVWAAQFAAPGGLGHRLQNRLLDVDRRSPNNWLDDNYWIKAAYHSNRSPLPINSNWWILLKRDKDIPKKVLESIPEPGRFTDWQLRRAATLVHRFMIFKQMLDRQEIIPDSSRAARWQRHWILDSLYGITRIPNRPHDHLNIPKPTARHIIVLARGHIYALDVLAPDRALLPAKQIEASLWAIVNHVTLQPAAIPVSCLTGLDRDRWADAREHLLLLSPTNRASLTTVEDALFSLSLDDVTRLGGIAGHIRTASSNVDGSNRWFDKSFAFIVESNARGSVSGEHSPCDALVPAIITDFVLAEGVGSGLCDPGVKAASHEVTDSRWTRLEWVTDQNILHAIEEGKVTVEAISNDSDRHLLWFDEYGADYIKHAAKQSPDAYIQMAMQLAWYRQIGSVVSTYETGLTRLFKHGRTDVIRTLSSESYTWVKAMDSKTADCHAVYNLFVQAVSAHNRYTKDVSLGRAFDRHFLGLRFQHRPEDDGPLPELFTDPMFAESAEWQISTSGLSAGERFLGTGFGCFGRGYGISYLAGPNLIKFGIETKVSDSRTTSVGFGEEICKALKDIRILCEKATGQRVEDDLISKL